MKEGEEGGIEYTFVYLLSTNSDMGGDGDVVGCRESTKGDSPRPAKDFVVDYTLSSQLHYVW